MHVGIDKFWDNGFRELLEPFKASDPDPEAADHEAALVAAEEVRAHLQSAGLRLVAGGHGDRWSLTLAGEVVLPDGVEVSAWPVTMPESYSRDVACLEQGKALVWDGIAPSSLCMLIGFSVTARHGHAEATIRFALKLPAEGFPEDRHARVMNQIIRNRSGFFRYLRLLLADLEGGTGPEFHPAGGKRTQGKGDGAGNGLGTVLLENLMRALSRHPDRLVPVDRLVTDLSRTEEGRRLIPDDFLALWSRFRQYSPELSGSKR